MKAEKRIAEVEKFIKGIEKRRKHLNAIFEAFEKERGKYVQYKKLQA